MNNLPGFIKKKKLLDSANLAAEECRKYGNLFLAAGWLADALDFFLKGNISEGLQQVEKIALDFGDAFLLERLLQVQDREASELWAQVADQAAAQEKYTMAEWAKEKISRNTQAIAAETATDKKSPGSMGDDHADSA